MSDTQNPWDALAKDFQKSMDEVLIAALVGGEAEENLKLKYKLRSLEMDIRTRESSAYDHESLACLDRKEVKHLKKQLRLLKAELKKKGIKK